MRAMSISGIRRAKSSNTTRSTPKDQCPMDRVNRHFAALAPNILWVADITYVKTRAGWVIRRVRHWRLLASDPGVADLHQLVHRPRPRRVENGDLASTPRRRRPNKPHSPFGSGRPVHRDPLRASPLPTATPSPRSAPRATPTTTRSPRHSTRCIKPNWSETRAPGTPLTTWRSRRPNGSTGTPPSALIPRSTCTPQKNMRTLTPHPRQNRPDPTPPKGSRRNQMKHPLQNPGLDSAANRSSKRNPASRGVPGAALLPMTQSPVTDAQYAHAHQANALLDLAMTIQSSGAAC